MGTSPTPTDPKLQFHSSCQVKTTFSDGNGIKKSLKKNTVEPPLRPLVKVVRYSFSGSIPPKFEHKLRRQNQSFGKIATTVVLDKDENLL